MSMENLMKERLEEALTPSHLEITNQSHLHAGHVGDDGLLDPGALEGHSSLGFEGRGEVKGVGADFNRASLRPVLHRGDQRLTGEDGGRGQGKPGEDQQLGDSESERGQAKSHAKVSC